MSPENANISGEHGPIYDEVYLALVPVTGKMALHGMFPFLNIHKRTGNVESILNNMKFSWRSKWMLLSLISICGIICCCFSVNYHYAIRIPDTLESLVLVFVVTMLNFTAMSNLCTMMVQGPKWRQYFQKWQTLDRYLDITLDQKLRSFARTVSIAYSIYVASAIGTVLLATFMKYYAPSEEDYSGDLFPLGMFCYSIFINSCGLLPEILFACFSVALKIRITYLTKKVLNIFDNQSPNTMSGKLEISDALQKVRIAYQNLLGIIRDTNSCMGPILFICVFLTAAYLSTTVLMVFFQSLENIGFISLKIVFSSCCILRLMSICIFSDQIKFQITQFKRVIYLIPSLQLRLSQESMDELALFLEYIKTPGVLFTASEFFDINKELLNKVGGAILTYTLTLFEFSQGT